MGVYQGVIMVIAETKSLSTIVRIILFLSFLIGVVACIYIISQGSMTDRESAMLGILVTILSVLASWTITEMYGTAQYREGIQEVREEHRNNLRTYALKAAEKVNNLSNELNKLSIYLEEELNYTDYRSTDEELLAKEERIESAIHLIRTLKSVNDTGLSDWEGVIGEELDQRREEQEEKEEALKELVMRVESLIEDHRQDFVGSQKDTRSVRQEVESLKRQLRLATFQLSEASIPRRIRRKEPKQDVAGDCPVCHTRISYKQRSSVRSVKLVPCKTCETKLVSTYTEPSGFLLKPRKNEVETAHCPHCGVLSTVPLDNFPGSNIIVCCSSCTHSFRLMRTLDGVEVTAVHPAVAQIAPGKLVVSEETLQKVRGALPPQPWPTGAHLSAAQQLGLQPSEVRRAVSELIKRGEFHPQIDGVVYVPSSQVAKDVTAAGPI